jgi:hypothetical protein
MQADLSGLFGAELANELDDALERIRHCLGQLSDEQVWRRSREDMNSIANVLLHLTGNLRQWVLAALGGTPDDRDRPAEFAARGMIPKAALVSRLEETVSDVVAVLRRTPAAEWPRVRRVQGFEVTGLGAALHSVAHFRGHTQEIVYMTRTILGDRYRFAWVPTTPEQGAPA